MSLITPAQASEILGIKSVTLYQQINRGTFYGPLFFKDDGLYFADIRDLLKYKKEYDDMKKTRNRSITVPFDDIEYARVKANAGAQTLGSYVRGRVL
jgi:hypothetical protein